VIHFHDLRHTGNMLAAGAGANLRELMDRMGHSTARAAMVYLHGSNERQQAVADALSKQTAGELGRSKTTPSGTQRHGGGGRHRDRAREGRRHVRRPGLPVCAPGRTRTCDLLLRRQLLYPTELRALAQRSAHHSAW
jgi:hypothetical protein